jgi:pyruvate/2-oxoglutarate dehydrogenase complex dihydrolipoamide dehydrogenase (E3) component
MVPERCQNVIIGSGEGGKYLAWHLAQLGQPTMVIERRWIGGSCPNINCLPSKNEIWSAKVAHLARHAGEFGTIAGSVSIDMVAVRRRKREMVEALVAIHLKSYRETGAQLVMGEAPLHRSQNPWHTQPWPRVSTSYSPTSNPDPKGA